MSNPVRNAHELGESQISLRLTLHNTQTYLMLFDTFVNKIFHLYFYVILNIRAVTLTQRRRAVAFYTNSALEIR